MEKNQNYNAPSDWKEQIRQSMITAFTGNEQEKKEADKEALEEKENKANGEEENQEFDGGGRR